MVLTTYDGDEGIFRALESGAYLLKDCLPPIRSTRYERYTLWRARFHSRRIPTGGPRDRRPRRSSSLAKAR